MGAGVGYVPPKEDPLDFSGQFNTPLSQDEEVAFRQWAGDRIADVYDYDLRGAWKGMVTGQIQPSPNGHLPDTFKKPNHITFSNESIYSSEDMPGGSWVPLEGGRFMFMPSQYNAQFHSADTYKTYFEQNEPNAQVVLPSSFDLGKNEAPAQNLVQQGFVEQQPPAVQVSANPNFYQVQDGATRFGGTTVSADVGQLNVAANLDNAARLQAINAKYGAAVGDNGYLEAYGDYQVPSKSYGLGVQYSEPNKSVGVSVRPKEKSVNVRATKKF